MGRATVPIGQACLYPVPGGKCRTKKTKGLSHCLKHSIASGDPALYRSVIKATCGACNGPGEIHPDPAPNGVFVCLNNCAPSREALAIAA